MADDLDSTDEENPAVAPVDEEAPIEAPKESPKSGLGAGRMGDQPVQPPVEPESVAPPIESAPALVAPEIAPAPAMVQPPPTPNQIIDQLTNPTAQQMDEHSLQFYQDIANRHIQPKTYKDLFAEKSTLGQLGLAFSILAGGIGAGLTHQSNAALDVMNKIIDRDFEAQKISKENANTFLKTEYDHQVQNAQKSLIEAQKNAIPISNEQIRANTKSLDADAKLKASTAAKNNMQIVAAAGEFTNMVNNMPEGPTKQNYQQALDFVLNSWKQQIGDNNAKTSAQLQARSALRNAPGSNQSASPNAEQQFASRNKALTLAGMPEQAQYNQEHHFPGLGDSSQSLSPSDRDRINSGISFQNELQGFTNWTRAHSGSLNPAEMNEGKALAAQLQAAYREATNGGVYKEGEQNFISKIITDNPTAFFNEIRKVPQLQAVQRESNAQLNQHLKSLGFQKKPEFQPTWSAESAKRPATGEAGIPTDGTKGMYQGKPYTWKNGKKVID